MEYYGNLGHKQLKTQNSREFDSRLMLLLKKNPYQRVSGGGNATDKKEERSWLNLDILHSRKIQTLRDLDTGHTEDTIMSKFEQMYSGALKSWWKERNKKLKYFNLNHSHLQHSQCGLVYMWCFWRSEGVCEKNQEYLNYESQKATGHSIPSGSFLGNRE